MKAARRLGGTEPHPGATVTCLFVEPTKVQSGM